MTNGLDWLHERVVRLGDAIFCLEEINTHPEMVAVLRKELEQAKADFQAEYDAEQAYIDARSRARKANIPDKIRWAVFERDNFTCQKCGSRRNLTVDHITPESRGGPLTMENTQTLCKSCNSRKGVK